MIAAYGKYAGVFDDTVGIEHVLGGATANIDDERAQFLLFIRKQRQRGGQTGKHDIIYLQLESFYGANGILQPVQISVDHMNIDFDTGPKHANGVGDALLAIHEKM